MKRDNIPGLEGYYISRLGILWSRYHKSGKLTQNEWHKVKPNHNQRGYLFVQRTFTGVHRLKICSNVLMMGEL